MVMGYQAYAGNGLLDGITTGVGLRQKYDEMKRQRGLADGMRRVAEGDETGWQQVAENSPATYMQKQAQDIQNARLQWDQEHRNDLTPYQREQLGLQRLQLQMQQENKAAKEKAETDALAKQQEEEQKSLDNAQAGVNAMQEVADRDNLTRFQDSWWNKWDEDIQRDQGQLASAIAAVAPRAIAKLKAAGVSGVNTLGEFMTYVGLPQNATNKQIAAAVPLISKIIGVETPKSKRETPTKEEAVAELKRRGKI